MQSAKHQLDPTGLKVTCSNSAGVMLNPALRGLSVWQERQKAQRLPGITVQVYKVLGGNSDSKGGSIGVGISLPQNEKGWQLNWALMDEEVFWFCQPEMPRRV